MPTNERLVVKYQGANYKNERGVYGCFSYYAREEDAKKFHVFVTPMTVWTNDNRDYLGHWYKNA